VHGFVPLSANPRWQRHDADTRVRVFADAYGLDEPQRRELVPMLARRTRAMYHFLARQARAGVQPWTGMWDTGHGDAWQADADYTHAHEAAWAGALLG
jgi:hypothetical protein